MRALAPGSPTSSRARHAATWGMIGAAAALLAVLVAAPAWACAACGTQKAENDWAFGLTTLFLSLFPPLLLAGLVAFLVRSSRRAARDELTHDAPTHDDATSADAVHPPAAPLASQQAS